MDFGKSKGKCKDHSQNSVIKILHPKTTVTPNESVTRLPTNFGAPSAKLSRETEFRSNLVTLLQRFEKFLVSSKLIG